MAKAWKKSYGVLPAQSARKMYILSASQAGKIFSDKRKMRKLLRRQYSQLSSCELICVNPIQCLLLILYYSALEEASAFGLYASFIHDKNIAALFFFIAGRLHLPLCCRIDAFHASARIPFQRFAKLLRLAHHVCRRLPRPAVAHRPREYVLRPFRVASLFCWVCFCFCAS